eukprot:gene5567-7690_t
MNDHNGDNSEVIDNITEDNNDNHTSLMFKNEEIERSPINNLNSLILHKSEIEQWIQLVQKKIYELETGYLEESHLGNIIKGFEIDGRSQAVPMRSRLGVINGVDEKDRLFSYSSYHTWLENSKSTKVDSTKKSSNGETSNLSKKTNTCIVQSAPFTQNKTTTNKIKKAKKRKSNEDSWIGLNVQDY